MHMDECSGALIPQAPQFAIDHLVVGKGDRKRVVTKHTPRCHRSCSRAPAAPKVPQRPTYLLEGNPTPGGGPGALDGCRPARQGRLSTMFVSCTPLRPRNSEMVYGGLIGRRAWRAAASVLTAAHEVVLSA